MFDDGHGKTHGRFTLPTLTAPRSRKMLLAIAAPKHQAATEGAGRPRLRRTAPWGRRSASSSNATPPRSSPGRRPQRHGAWSLIDETPWSGGRARLVSSTPASQISPAWPGGSPAQAGSSPSSSAATPRSSTWAATPVPHHGPALALMLRDGGCTAEGCDRATGHRHAHHDTRWADGGTPTSTTVDCSAAGTTPGPTTPPYQMTHRPAARRLPPTQISRPVDARPTCSNTVASPREPRREPLGGDVQARVLQTARFGPS